MLGEGILAEDLRDRDLLLSQQDAGPSVEHILESEQRAMDALGESDVSSMDSDEASQHIATNKFYLAHKERKWNELNKEWLALQEKKEQERAAKMRGTVEEERDAAERKVRSAHVVGNHLSPFFFQRRKQKKRKERLAAGEDLIDEFGVQRPVPRTAAEAAHGEMQKRNSSRKSAKIDYSVLNQLLGGGEEGKGDQQGLDAAETAPPAAELEDDHDHDGGDGDGDDE